MRSRQTFSRHDSVAAEHGRGLNLCSAAARIRSKICKLQQLRLKLTAICESCFLGRIGVSRERGSVKKVYVWICPRPIIACLMLRTTMAPIIATNMLQRLKPVTPVLDPTDVYACAPITCGKITPRRPGMTPTQTGGMP